VVERGEGIDRQPVKLSGASAGHSGGKPGATAIPAPSHRTRRSEGITRLLRTRRITAP